MFGKNEIVGQKYFSDSNSNQLLVTSIFLTLQGEGPFRGKPAVFIRLAKCNLACSFCDTFFDSGDILTFDEIFEKINNLLEENYDTKKLVLVLTGGEPMLQKNIGAFLELANEKFSATQIESNGIVWQDIPPETILVISPKCLEKNGVAIKYLKPNEKILQRADCLKFVIEDSKESPYYTIPDWALDFKKDVYISPINVYNEEPKQTKQDKVSNTLENRSLIDEKVSFWQEGLLDRKQNQKNHEYAARYCLDNNLILNLQLHLYASLP